MMWLLLFVLTLAVVLLPMVPAFLEWRRPSDVVPLHIDTRDAQDPSWLAHSFFQQLTVALSQQRRRLGRSRLRPAPSQGDWLRTDAELRAGASRTVWYADGDLRLPLDADLLGEVAATGDIRTAITRVYRALWAGGRLKLAPESTVLRWAHAQDVEVAQGCRLGGRISAERSLRIGRGVHFSLLHAPVVHFSGDNPQADAANDVDTAFDAGADLDDDAGGVHGKLGLPAEVVWNPVADRGVASQSLQVRPGRAWRGDLVCHGDLLLGRGTRVRGSIKTWGELRVDVGSRVVGNLVAVGQLALGADCVVQGAVVSETAVLLGAGCVVGTPEAPCTVTAPRIVVAAGATVHGTLWATEHGSTPESAGAALAAPGDSEPWPEQAWA